MTRWMHPPELERDRRRDAFDPIVEGARYQLSRELSLALWERVCAKATDSAGRRDTEQAEQRFHEIAARIAARGGRLRPDVGRLTCVGVELDGDSPRAWFDDELGPRVPGRETLVMAEARQRAQLRDQPATTRQHAERAATEQRDHHAKLDELPGASELRDALAALQLPLPPPQLRDRPATTRQHVDRDAMEQRDDHAKPDPLPGASELREALAALQLPLPPGQASAARERPSRPAPAAAQGSRPAQWLAALTPEARLAQARAAFSHALRPRASDNQQALAAARPPSQPEPTLDHGSGERRLPVPTLDRMQRAFGQRFDDVELHADSAEVPRGALAFTRGRHIHLEPGAFGPDTEQGEHVIAHELAHVAQQSQSSTPARPPTRAALEADAHQAALAALAGRSASVSLFAPASAALGFSNGEPPQHPASAPGAPSHPVQSAHGSAPAPAPRTPGSASRNPGGTGGRPAPTARPAGTNSKASAPATAPAPPRGASGDKLLVPEAPRTLTPAAAGRLQSTQAGNQGVAAATTTLPTAEQQTTVAREAVVEPQAEQDAHAQHGVVTEVDDRPPPSPEIEEACARIRQVIRDKRPPDEDKLVDAKPKDMAQEAGQQMSAGVEQRTGAVREGYADMQQNPQGTPSTTPVPATLPPERAQTQPVDATAGTPDPLKPDDVSLDGDVAAQQKEIQDAGMNTEPGKLVQDGPIGDARGGVDDLHDQAKADPQKVLADQAAAIAKAKGDMRALQDAGEKALADARAGTVSDIGKHTTSVKGSEEQQRAQAGEKMKTVFTGAQTSVDKLLQPLSGNAVARWDSGVAQLSTDFEASLADVKRRIDERHSGTFGFAKAAWDWGTGLPDWVTEGYDRAEAKFGDGATNLIRDISRDVNAVIEDCKKIIEQARKDIEAIVRSLPASLQTWAQGEAAKLNQQLDGLDKRVDQTQQGINKDLISHANGAVQQVRERVAQLREEAKGALAKIAAAIVEFAKNPFKAIVDGLLRILGIPPASFWSLVDKLGDVVGAIAKDPVKFGKTLISGAAQGFKQFFEHFPTHLKEILMGWLFGTMGTAGVPMPTDFSGPGIMPTVLGIIGIDTSMISSMLGADVNDPAEMAEVHQELAGVLSGDPHALVALLRDHFDPASLIPMIREAAMSFLIQALIMQVAPRIAAMLVPGGAILQAVEAIFKVLMWVVSNAARIFTLIESLVATAGQAVAGNVSGVAAGVESGLVQIIVLVIDFLAGYIGLGGLGAKLKGVIMKVSGKLKGILKKVLDAIKKRAKGKAKAKHPHAPDHDKPGAAPHPKQDDRDPQKAKDDAKDPRNHKADPDDKDPRTHKPDADDKDPRSHHKDDDKDPRNHRKDDDKDPRDHKPDKDKDKDKDKDRDQDDRATARRAAHAAAERAWAKARAATTPKLLNQSQLDSLLAGEGDKQGKATVMIKLKRFGTSWSVEAHVRLGSVTEVATAGHGWIATERSGQPWFAATDYSPANRQIIHNAKEAVTKHAQQDHKPGDIKTANERLQTVRADSLNVEHGSQRELDSKIHGLNFAIEITPHGSDERGREVRASFEIAPNMSDDQAILSLGSDDEGIERLDTGKLSVDERRALLADARRVVNNAALVSRILSEVRNHGTGNNTAVQLLKKLIAQTLTGGYKLNERMEWTSDSPRTLCLEYYGVFQAASGLIGINNVKRDGSTKGLGIGLAYVKPIKADAHGEDPIAALAMDFLVAPAIEKAGVRGVGSEMVKRAAAKFQTQHEAVVGEWYKMDGYAKGGRSDLSVNLQQYIAARKRGRSEQDAVRETWTYNRVKEIYGAANLRVTVREFQDDWDNLQEGKVVEAVMRPE